MTEYEAATTVEDGSDSSSVSSGSSGSNNNKPGGIDEDDVQKLSLAADYSAAKLLVSLAQAVWASVTLYQARGNQVQLYGYAAFGLTVAPYAFMSVVNSVATLLTPSYQAVYLLRTPIMDEAEQRGGFFEGELRAELRNKGVREAANWEVFGGVNIKTKSIIAHLGLACGLLPLAIVGALSRFRPERSSALERGFTMAWLVCGIFPGYLLPFMYIRFSRRVLCGWTRTIAREQLRSGFYFLLSARHRQLVDLLWWGGCSGSLGYVRSSAAKVPCLKF
jgi:hypothetical protein